MFTHLYTIQFQLAANFFLQIAPSEHVLEVALASKSVKTNVAINRLSKVFFGRTTPGKGEKRRETLSCAELSDPDKKSFQAT